MIGALEKWIEKEIGTVGNRRKNQDDPFYCIVEITQNTEKIPGDLRRFAVNPIFCENPAVFTDGKISQGQK